ncbi:uncharacterized protein TRIVIDRAFT_217402 [Trichoderma virens Gv29-8]|uniref:Uncharacterized protein n=1 Tax=Hypocrea virens (strain Gv29-8 / FGSC 10586) TaxID=413071 RepID=G9MFP0_HYPVG|nr:uncharacterized protein TRIVIDRAFT_217402 [Trichoderma virens Gv29-8]EHK26787.1 hypothetical protein TRIVIDRAFT_217402 [Trichoderma virens Gv29-8]UKZ57241.1 hypothetical protein TrVGV298_011094 [Trichoderma virens]
MLYKPFMNMLIENNFIKTLEPGFGVNSRRTLLEGRVLQTLGRFHDPVPERAPSPCTSFNMQLQESSICTPFNFLRYANRHFFQHAFVDPPSTWTLAAFRKIQPGPAARSVFEDHIVKETAQRTNENDDQKASRTAGAAHLKAFLAPGAQEVKKEQAKLEPLESRNKVAEERHLKKMCENSWENIMD